MPGCRSCWNQAMQQRYSLVRSLSMPPRVYSPFYYIHSQTSVPMKNTDDYVPHVRARFLERCTKEN